MSKKKKLSVRLYDWITGRKPQPVRRSYAAARLNKNNANWTTWPTGANYEQRNSLAALRARARQASRDNGHIKHFLGLTRANIVGPKGIQLECQARKSDNSPNDRVNKMIEDAFWQWGHAETCTLSGKLNWTAVQRLVVTRLACDGEFLVQMVARADNPFGFSLKIWDVNWLDETFNETQPNGNRVIMSVEIDANERPVAYWLTTPASEINFTQRRARQRMRVPAEQMIHGFLCLDDEAQARGVTWFHAALLNAKNYQGYEEGVIQSARMTSNTFGFIKQTVPDTEEYTGEIDPETGEWKLPDIDVTPLSVSLLNSGQEFQQFDPKQPTQNHAAFAKTVLMALAAALDVPYFYLAGDMEAVNFSSSRVGLDDARDIWRALQDFVAETLCRRVYHEWLRSALLTGQITLTERDYAQCMSPNWRGRGWKYIDPVKDATADIERLKHRLATPSQILAEQGEDYVDFLARWQQDRNLAAAYGIDIDEVYSAQKALPPAAEPDDDDEPEPKDDAERAFVVDAEDVEITWTNGNGHKLLR